MDRAQRAQALRLKVRAVVRSLVLTGICEKNNEQPRTRCACNTSSSDWSRSALIRAPCIGREVIRADTRVMLVAENLKPSPSEISHTQSHREIQIRKESAYQRYCLSALGTWESAATSRAPPELLSKLPLRRLPWRTSSLIDRTEEGEGMGEK